MTVLLAQSGFNNLSSLELRLELSQRIGNHRLDLLERIYNGETALAHYLKGKMEFHMHALAFPDMLLDEDTIGALVVRRIKVCAVLTAAAHAAGLALQNYSSALIIFGELPQQPEGVLPIPSSVWLQPLNSCRMKLVDALEVGVAPRPELIWAVQQRELNVLLRGAGIENSQFVCQEIKSQPQVIDNFSSHDGDFSGDVRTLFTDQIKKHVGGVFIQTRNLPHQLVFFVNKVANKGLQITKAFFCPTQPDISSIKEVHDVLLRTTAQAVPL